MLLIGQQVLEQTYKNMLIMLLYYVCVFPGVWLLRTAFDEVFLVNYPIGSSNSEMKCLHQCCCDREQSLVAKGKALQTTRVRADGLKKNQVGEETSTVETSKA